MAEQLEFFFEEVATIDENGNIIGLDIDKAEERFGNSPDLELLKEEIEEQEDTMYPMINPDGPNGEAIPMRNCLNTKVKNEWKSYITGAVATNILDAIMSKNYKKGAKLLIKHGVRGSIPGIVVTLGQHWYACYKEVG